MKTIYKYPISIADEQESTLPFGAEVIRVGLDPQDVPCVWAIVDTEQLAAQLKTIFVIGTGQEVRDDFFNYLGSFNQGPFVWHVFST